MAPSSLFNKIFGKTNSKNPRDIMHEWKETQDFILDYFINNTQSTPTLASPSKIILHPREINNADDKLEWNYTIANQLNTLCHLINKNNDFVHIFGHIEVVFAIATTNVRMKFLYKSDINMDHTQQNICDYFQARAQESNIYDQILNLILNPALDPRQYPQYLQPQMHQFSALLNTGYVIDRVVKNKEIEIVFTNTVMLPHWLILFPIICNATPFMLIHCSFFDVRFAAPFYEVYANALLFGGKLSAAHNEAQFLTRIINPADITTQYLFNSDHMRATLASWRSKITLYNTYCHDRAINIDQHYSNKTPQLLSQWVCDSISTDSSCISECSSPTPSNSGLPLEWDGDYYDRPNKLETPVCCYSEDNLTSIDDDDDGDDNLILDELPVMNTHQWTHRPQLTSGASLDDVGSYSLEPACSKSTFYLH